MKLPEGITSRHAIMMMKEDEMTQEKYKVGDDILVKAKIIHDDKQLRQRYRIEGDGCRLYWIAEDEIYSLAPEFTPGEEIEVRTNEIDYWRSATYIGVNPFSYHKHAVIYKGNKTSFKYARKIRKEPEIITVNGKRYKEIEE